jgi:hypothetical protein
MPLIFPKILDTQYCLIYRAFGIRPAFDILVCGPFVFLAALLSLPLCGYLKFDKAATGI